MRKLLKIGCGSILALFVLLIVIGLIFSEKNTENKPESSNNVSSSEASNSNETTNSETSNAEDKVTGVGEELIVGDVSFTVHGFEETTQISAANGFVTYTPDSQGAVFLVVNLTVKNLGNEMIQTDSSFFKIKSDSGAEYSPTSVVIADDKYFLYEGINPGLGLTGNVVFEVPSGLVGLNLNVQTGFWGTETGQIKLN